MLKIARKWGCLLYFMSLSALADGSKDPAGIGKVAKNLLEPVAYASDFVYTACFVIGGSFLFASLIKYVEHRRNPLAVTIGTVVFLLIAGLFLIAMPFAYLVIHNGSPYTLLK